jgi:ABC-2 type transport system ATP-binding protein
MTAVLADGLTKRYATTTALDGFDLEVPEGMVCGLLGPNGAGKTTAVRILATLLRPDGGQARVAGFDVVRHGAEVRRRIGLVGQHAAVDEILSGRQNLEMIARLHHLGARAARATAIELLERFGLEEAADRPAGQYSGGMRRRLDLAAGLVIDPAVLFLDEPTTGLDPHGRADVWDAVRSLAERGTTVLLTSQYLEEADRLAGTVCVADHGKVVAVGTPDELKTRLGGDRIDVTVHDPADLPAVAEILAKVSGAVADVDPGGARAGVPVRDRIAALADIARALDEAGLAVADLTLRRPTLDEVFIHFTKDVTKDSEGAAS